MIWQFGWAGVRRRQRRRRRRRLFIRLMTDPRAFTTNNAFSVSVTGLGDFSPVGRFGGSILAKVGFLLGLLILHY